jgi:hypothetical protein
MQHAVYNLVDLVQQGQFLEALEAFYAEGIEMSENLNAPTVGKEANRQREVAWVNTIRELHEYRAETIIAEGDRSAINWVVDYVDVNGLRIQMNQFAIQEWKDGKIVRERFVYDPGSVSAVAA